MAVNDQKMLTVTGIVYEYKRAMFKKMLVASWI